MRAWYCPSQYEGPPQPQPQRVSKQIITRDGPSRCMPSIFAGRHERPVKIATAIIVGFFFAPRCRLIAQNALCRRAALSVTHTPPSHVLLLGPMLASPARSNRFQEQGALFLLPRISEDAIAHTEISCSYCVSTRSKLDTTISGPRPGTAISKIGPYWRAKSIRLSMGCPASRSNRLPISR
jgi:hypothetical protein